MTGVARREEADGGVVGYGGGLRLGWGHVGAAPLPPCGAVGGRGDGGGAAISLEHLHEQWLQLLKGHDAPALVRKTEERRKDGMIRRRSPPIGDPKEGLIMASLRRAESRSSWRPSP